MAHAAAQVSMCALMVFAHLLTAAEASSHLPAGTFESQCASDKNYGWPRFNTRAELEGNHSWALYYTAVYGQLPTVYPVCVYDQTFIDWAALSSAGLNTTRPVVTNLTALAEGDLFSQSNIAGKQYGIYHERWTALPDNAWVEITHGVPPTELSGTWCWRQRGSGVWVNMGRTTVFPTPANINQTHAAAIAFLVKGCTCKISPYWPQRESDIFGCCAREKGYDSIQFAPQDGQVPTGTFGLAGLVEFVITHTDGDLTCGVANASDTPYRSGWRASHPCNCTNVPIPPDCGVMAFPPPGIDPHPPICAVQGVNKSRACNPLHCLNTKCRLD